MEDLVRNARRIALEALRDDVRGDGRPFIGHPDGVARIVEDEIGLGPECIAAVYLHEATRFHPEVDISAFPQDVLTMVEGLTKIATIKPKDTRLEAENYKKLIIRYSTDPRVTLLKIADRLEVMRNLHLFSKTAREQKILETLMLYIPLAHQLGLYNIKSELEDIYFKYAEPDQYRAITRKLKATERERQKLMEEFIRPLEKELSDEGIRYKLKIRTKTAWSIYRKMLKQQVPFEGVYDVFAIRFIVDCDEGPKAERELCWKVYSHVTREYEPDISRLRDWLSNPKPNGYESLHITVKNARGSYLEVQIRSKRMDDMAESGLASHWSYKGIKTDKTIEGWLQTVRYQLEHPYNAKPEDLPQPPDKEIFVFTPTGELKILPAGASVLDFAFSIHTGLGCHCTGGRVNGKAVAIKEKLETGDVVEIMSSRNQKPSADWLNWVVSSKARSKIKVELDSEVRKKAAEGRELLERRLKNWRMSLPDELVANIMHHLKYTSVISFMAAVGDGTIDINDIKAYILDPGQLVNRAATTEEEERHGGKSSAKGGEEILVINAKGVKGLEYKMAACCHPVYGDDVFGFVTRTEGIKIHRKDCPNAPRLREMFPYRIQRVIWQEKPNSADSKPAGKHGRS
ncbi:MAG: bifunctional (p)ppGpp synthetase/guanosine-3',5'-bis(diphosphate) 3'-pyrophosphohydrolase [Bacteroidales bacterium]|nr:bifunctional (p)ppGpp synthetase/guanosine-3',5'-bis(diphosphate) 3'-pyrophosphohydrolase [Bacteroidales bacterium]